MVPMPTFSKRRKAAFGDNRYCEVALRSAVSLARGMFPQRLAGNPRELPISFTSGGTPPKGVEGNVQPRVDRRKHGRMAEQSYNPIVPMKVGNRRASARSGHGTHWREGGSKRTNLLKGDIIGTQNSNCYVHRHRQNS
jgi:hypothetical protein